jgi:glycosyltransferase involved in cell wall biosynthesis
MVKRATSEYTWFQYVKEDKPGLSNARNCGAKVARGKYLCYIDDDTKLGEIYLSSLFHVLQKHQPDIVGGPVLPYYTTQKPKWFRDEYEIRRHISYSGFSKDCSVSGGNFVIKSDLLKSLGYFSPKFGMIGDKTRLGEEKAVMFIYRKNVPVELQCVFYSQECFLYHHVPDYKMRLSYMLKRSFLAGRANVQIKKKKAISLPKFYKELYKCYFNDLFPMLLLGGRRGNDDIIMAILRAALVVGKIIQVLRTTTAEMGVLASAALALGFNKKWRVTYKKQAPQNTDKSS